MTEMSNPQHGKYTKALSKDQRRALEYVFPFGGVHEDQKQMRRELTRAIREENARSGSKGWSPKPELKPAKAVNNKEVV